MDCDNKFEQICFCCLTEVGQMKDMLHEVFTFAEPNIKIQFVESYTICAGIDQSQIDDTSVFICLNCEGKLRASYEFRELCRTSYRIYKEKTGSAIKDVVLVEIKNEIPSDGEEMNFVYDDSSKKSSHNFNQVFVKENDQLAAVPRLKSVKRAKSEHKIPKVEDVAHSDQANDWQDVKPKSSKKLKPSKPKNPKLEDLTDSGLNESTFQAKYICYHCDFYLPTHEQYLMHRESQHMSGNGFLRLDRICNICGDNVKGYIKHIEDCHKDYKPNTCNACPIRYQSQNELKMHLVSHLNLTATHECLGCREKFKTETNLRNHISTKKHTDHLYHCPYCGLGHSQFLKLHEHFMNFHDSTKKLYPCFECKKIYMVKKFYSVHECVKNQKKLLKKMEKVKTERSAAITDSTVANKCSRCLQEFFNAEQFACHQFLECEDDNNQCSVCDKAFDTRRKLARHKRHHTYIEKTCICDICGHTSVNESQMRIHKSRHSELRPFKCQSCPAAFKLDHMLKSHQIVHKEKEFECDICGKKFRNYHSIRLHMAVHADITDVRRFTCELCGKSTVSGTALTRHLKIHTNERNVKCEVCSRAFRDVGGYNKHYRKVHEGLFYECKYCGKTCIEKPKFRNHLYIHRGFKPFHCPACPSQFIEKYLFVKHLRVHHSIDFNEKVHGYREKENINAIIQECMRIPFKNGQTPPAPVKPNQQLIAEPCRELIYSTPTPSQLVIENNHMSSTNNELMLKNPYSNDYAKSTQYI